MSTVIYLVRHGETTYNRDYIVCGHVDPPLTERGITQAQQLSEKLREVTFGGVYTSDLSRAVRTAEIITGQDVPTGCRLFELRERSFGKLDGKPEEQLDALAVSKWAEFNRLSDADRWRFKYAPDIESDHELSTRFIAALRNVARHHEDQIILVVAHGGAMRTTVMKLMGLATDTLPKGAFSNGAVIRLAYDHDTLTVESVNS